MRSAALSVYLARATATVPEGPIDELAPLAEKLLEVPIELVRTALGLELTEGNVVADITRASTC